MKELQSVYDQSKMKEKEAYKLYFDEAYKLYEFLRGESEGEEG